MSSISGTGTPRARRRGSGQDPHRLVPCHPYLKSLVTGVLIYFLYLRFLMPANEQQEGLDAATDDPAGSFTRVFTVEELEGATSGYSASKLLSSGDTGEYHEGVLADRTAIAVKHARPCFPRSRSEIIRDVEILTRVDHPSLARFLGYHLNELDHPLLVYEFVPNGDLFNWLHLLRRPLPWRRRLAIAQQAAEGLAHLFSLTPPIFHRDLKAKNILLDEQFNAKVSDFGQAELVTTGIGRAHAWARETLGDLYCQHHQLLDFEKIDVHSFGVVLLELMSTLEVVDWTREPSERFLAEYARRMAMEGRFAEVVEGAMKEAASEAELESMKALGLLALRCVEDLWQLRPTMKEVAEAIKNIVGVLCWYCFQHIVLRREIRRRIFS